MGKHFTFSGYATRKQYWLNQLAVVGVMVLATFIMSLGIAAGTEGAAIISLLVAVPMMIAAGVSAWSYGARRVRDTGNSAWLILLVLIPYVGIIPLLYFTLTSKSITNGTIEAK